MKKLFYRVYYIFFSLLFSLQSIIFINKEGDQTWFAKSAKSFHYDYLGFAISRYYSWSSRLLIESATMFFSVHYIIFDIALLLSTYVLFIILDKLLITSEKFNKLRFAIPILLVLIFPSQFFLGAGLIATVTNYYFPMITFICALYLIQKDKIYFKIISLLLFVFSMMQEQFAVIAFLFILIIMIMKYLKKEQFSLGFITLEILSLIGIISVIISPGSALRKLSEIKSWYPEFDKIGVVDKVFLGFIDTNNTLFLGNEINIMYLLFALFVFVSVIKRKYLITLFSGALLFSMIQYKLGMVTFLTTLHDILPSITSFRISIATMFVLLIFILFLTCIPISIWCLIDDFEIRILLIFGVIICYIGRMLVAFSPTIYASGVRTHLPILMGGYILSLMLVRETILYKEV